MFDDTPQKPGNIPVNLPFIEPEDIFSSVEEASSPVLEAGLEQAVVSQQEEAPSALEAGILRPKVTAETAPPLTMDAPSRDPRPYTPPPTEDMFRETEPARTLGTPKMRGPFLSRGLIGIGIGVIAFAIIGVGGWLVYRNMTEGGGDSKDFDTPSLPQETNSLSAPSTEAAIDNKVLFGDVVDSDEDGIDDVEEKQRGTDPLHWDSDRDELSDGDELLIWKTNPLNPDTDGDTFKDGLEVRSGYSPSGPGKFSTVPKKP